MGVNLNNKVSWEDREALEEKKNPPKFETDFAEEGDSFDDFDFGDSSSKDSSEGFDSFGDGGFDSFGSSGFGNGGFDTFGNNGFGTLGQQQEQKPDIFDELFEMLTNGIKGIGNIISDFIKSIKTKNAQDWGKYSNALIGTNTIFALAMLVISIIGSLANVKWLGFGGIGGQLFASGLIGLGCGMIGMATTALVLGTRLKTDKNNSLSSTPIMNNDFDDTFDSEDIESFKEDKNIDDNFEINDEDFDDIELDFDDEEEDIKEQPQPPRQYDTKEEDVRRNINYDNLVDGTEKKGILTRETLYDAFKPFFPKNTNDFSKVAEISKNSDTFKTLEILLLKALATVKGCTLTDVDSQLIKAKETLFSYELLMSRWKEVKNANALQKEVLNYFREDSNDKSVNCSVYLEGDNYKIIVTKGTKAIVTLGDCLSLPNIENFYRNDGNILPCIAGIDELGVPVPIDAKHFDTMLIAGKPRSGKSWYVLSLLMSMMAFNTPEEIEFLIIDPKESNLFKTMSLMPHVCGLHNDKNIIKILSDIINKEAPKRKELLNEYKCDDIWALRKKGVVMPVLYIVIDEIMTVLANLGKVDAPTFFELLTVIISQLPSLGIRVIMVPHRAQGVVDKTLRTLLSYVAAVRADSEIVEETLGIKGWEKTLQNPGDTAIKMLGKEDPMFVKSCAITTSDSENSNLIEQIAKTFYKMGVIIPDMSGIGMGNNRDEEYIKNTLSLGDDYNKVQYDANKIKNENIKAQEKILQPTKVEDYYYDEDDELDCEIDEEEFNNKKGMDDDVDF